MSPGSIGANPNVANRDNAAFHCASAGEAGVATIAEQVGYNSTNAFNVAFARHAGVPPTQYIHRQLEPPQR